MDVTAQVALLERRGLSFADKSRAEEFLLRENYYAVVNGYKDAFIDRQATNLAHDDRYAQGTSFEDLMLIYTFDKSLRAETIRVLLDAETCMKTDTIYAFCNVFRGADDYLVRGILRVLVSSCDKNRFPVHTPVTYNRCA